MSFDEEYFKSDEFRELLSSYESSVASGDNMFLDADDLVDIADYYNMTDNPERAKAVVVEGLTMYPHHVLLNVFMARKALENEDVEEAERIAERIDDKEAPDYHYLRAEILIAQNCVDEADQYLRNYSKTVSADEYGDFVKDVANLYVDYMISDKAYEWMMRSPGDESDDFKELMARTLFGLGKYKDASRLLTELIDNQPFAKRYWTSLAMAQFMDKDYNEAVTSAEYALAIDPKDPDGLMHKASGLMKLGNYEQAAEYFKRYSEVCPDDALGFLHRAVCLTNLDRKKEAIPLLLEAVPLAEDEEVLSHAILELAFCYSANGELDKAMDILNKAEQLNCDHDDIQIVRGHLLLSHNLVDEAEKVFSDVLTNCMNKPDLVLRIIASLYENRYVKAAYIMLKSFFENIQDKNFDNGYSYMALFCWELHYDKEFLRYLKKAVEVNPEEARLVLSNLFPEELPAEEYYNYMKKQIKA